MGLFLIRRVHTGNNAGDDVEENQLGIDFLNLETTLDTVREGQRDAVFQKEKRSFNAPAAVVEVQKIIELEILGGKICNKILHTAIFESNFDKTEGEMKGRRLVRGMDQVKGPVGANVFLLIGRHIGEALVGATEKDVGKGLETRGIRDQEMLEGRGVPAGFLDAKQEKKACIGNSSHVIEGVKAAISDKEALTRDRIAPHHRDKSVLFIHLGTRLNHSIGIDGLQKVIHDGEVELMVATLLGIVGYISRSVVRLRGDIQVRTVTGKKMIALEKLFKAKQPVKLGKQRGESRVVELGTLAYKRSPGRYSVPGSGGVACLRMNDGPIVADFAIQRAVLHEHCQQERIPEGKLPMANKIMAGISDILVQMSFHVGKDFEELSSDDAWGEMDTHMRYLLETGCGKHHQFQGPHSLHLNSDKENAAAYFCRFVKLYGNIYQNINIQKGLLDTSCGCHAACPICFAVDSPSKSVSCGGIFVNAVWHNT